jgi:iron complex transport system ATP-binding protein
MSIRCQNIHYGYQDNDILSDISLAFNPGEFTIILGPNGCGKTTLLKLLGGVLIPRCGDIFFKDQPMSKVSAKEMSQSRSVLPQSTQLTFPYTAMEVVLMGRTPHVQWLETDQDFEIAEKAMVLSEVLEFKERLYPTLSGGEQQRINFSRALAQIWSIQDTKRDRFLFLDEPTSSLDPSHQEKILDVAREWTQKGVGVIAVLHDMNLAAHYASRLVVLHQKKVYADGPVEQVLTQRMMQEVFKVKTEIISHPQTKRPLVIRSA